MFKHHVFRSIVLFAYHYECYSPATLVPRHAYPWQRVRDMVLFNNDLSVCHGFVFPTNELFVPDSVRELCDYCFYMCKDLRRVVFGSLSNIELFGEFAFSQSGLKEIFIPDGVREIPDYCFSESRLRRVIFGAHSKLERIGRCAFYRHHFCEVSIPDSVCELGAASFSSHIRPCRVIFGAHSHLVRIGDGAFAMSVIEEISIPDSVRELGDRCLESHMDSIHRVIFGA